MMMRDKVKNIINNAQQLLCHRCTGATTKSGTDALKEKKLPGFKQNTLLIVIENLFYGKKNAGKRSNIGNFHISIECILCYFTGAKLYQATA